MDIRVHLKNLEVRLRLEKPLTDRELWVFCSATEVLRVERNAEGEIELRSPNDMDGAILESKFLVQLALWT